MCNCNKIIKPKGNVVQIKNIIKKMWKNTQFNETSLVIKK